MNTRKPTVRIQAEPFDEAAESRRLTEGQHDVGALVVFTGICRNEGGILEALELEHYPGMAEAEIRRIADQAVTRWPLTDLTVIHRHGKLIPGEPIVFVATAAKHRQAAFEAASFVMDFLKTRAPFWKKEHRADGSVGGWVPASSSDDDATGRW